MNSSIQYSLQDLYFDKVNLASINKVKQNCVKYAMQFGVSQDLFSIGEIESFIEWADEFHEKKLLIFYVNGSKLKYQRPTLSDAGLRVREATELSLSHLKYYLKRLEYLGDNPKSVSRIVSKHFVQNLSIDPEGINAMSDAVFMASVCGFSILEPKSAVDVLNMMAARSGVATSSGSQNPQVLATDISKNLQVEKSIESDNYQQIPCQVDDSDVKVSSDAMQASLNGDAITVCENECSVITSSSAGVVHLAAVAKGGTPPTTVALARYGPEMPTTSTPNNNNCAEESCIDKVDFREESVPVYIVFSHEVQPQDKIVVANSHGSKCSGEWVVVAAAAASASASGHTRTASPPPSPHSMRPSGDNVTTTPPQTPRSSPPFPPHVHGSRETIGLTYYGMNELWDKNELQSRKLKEKGSTVIVIPNALTGVKCSGQECFNELEMEVLCSGLKEEPPDEDMQETKGNYRCSAHAPASECSYTSENVANTDNESLFVEYEDKKVATGTGDLENESGILGCAQIETCAKFIITATTELQGNDTRFNSILQDICHFQGYEAGIGSYMHLHGFFYYKSLHLSKNPQDGIMNDLLQEFWKHRWKIRLM